MSLINLKTPRVFVPLLGRSRYKAAWGGRASGKSHFMAETLVLRCLESWHDDGVALRAVSVRETQTSLKESAKRLIEDKIAALGVGAEFDVLVDRIKTPGGGVIIFQGMADHTAESIKSLEGFDVAWVEEAQSLSGRSLELLRPTIRKPRSELWFSWNPRRADDPVDKLFRGAGRPDDAVVVRANYSDNPHLPHEMEMERRECLAKQPNRYGHIWLGEYEPQAEGAIWTMQVIEDGRINQSDAPEMTRIVVAVDPNVTDGEHSDEHGIVVVGLGTDKRGYVLDDLSGRGGPAQWAARAVAAYDKWQADAVVIETNQGGQMCRETLRTARRSLPVIEVTASRGKHVRAEPIAALYALGQISHVGRFPTLESQMCLMTHAGYAGDGSPDHVDALVWGMTHLFPMVGRREARPTQRDTLKT